METCDVEVPFRGRGRWWSPRAADRSDRQPGAGAGWSVPAVSGCNPSARRWPGPGPNRAGRPAARSPSASRAIQRPDGLRVKPAMKSLADDRRAVKPDEQLGVEPFLERGHRMVDQPAAAADVQPHVIALGRHPVDVAGGDPHQAGQVRRPEFLEPLRVLAGARPGSVAVLRDRRGRGRARAAAALGSTGFIR